MVAAAIIGSAVVGGVGSALSAKSAAKAQTTAAANSNALLSAQYQQTRGDLSPYNQAGQGALNMLQRGLGTAGPSQQGGQSGYAGQFGSPGPQGGNTGSPNWSAYAQQNPDVMAGYNALPDGARAMFPTQDAYSQYHYQNYGQSEGRQVPTEQALAPGQGGMPDGYLTHPFSMTQANLEQTPGYQFNLSQGLKTVNNALGARGLLDSGAVLKGGAEYATGLADNTYMNQFNMDQSQKSNIYNRLIGTAGLGESAAAQTGAFGTQTAGQQGANLVGAGNAQAAGSIAVGNAFAGVANAVPNALISNKLLNNGYFGGGYQGIYGQSSGALPFGRG